MKYFIFLIFLFSFLSYSQECRVIEWKGHGMSSCQDSLIETIDFKNGFFNKSISLNKIYFETIPVDSKQVDLEFYDLEFTNLTEDELNIISLKDLGEEILVDYNVVTKRKKHFLCFQFIPFRIHDDIIQKLDRFKLKIEPSNETVESGKKIINNSVLNTGNWYKMGVVKDGIYEINSAFLDSVGVDITLINPNKIRIYGNNAGSIEEGSTEIDDLQELSIYVQSENDTVFTVSDKIFFFGQAPHTWSYSKEDNMFRHQTNIYSDTTYYFISFDQGIGKRIKTIAPPNSINEVEYVSSTYDAYLFHELELVNLLNSGRRFFGESFALNQNQNFSYNIENIDLDSPIYLEFSLAARSSVVSSFQISYNLDVINSVEIAKVGTHDNSDYFNRVESGLTFYPTSENGLTVSFLYNNNGNPAAIAWLDYFRLSYRKKLIFENDQFLFRDVNSLNKTTNFQITTSSNDIQVWNVTDPINVSEIPLSNSSFGVEFDLNSSDSIHNFIAFNKTDNFIPYFSGFVPNQNLHGVSQPTYVIVTHPKFLEAANRLGDFHANENGESVLVCTTDQVYNEFSTGSQDVSAIRNLMKMFYDRSNHIPRNLLLFGDASFDYKNSDSENSNYVPTYQTSRSANLSSSYCTDDYFGVLDHDEGDWQGLGNTSDLIDIGIGRLPVMNLDQANSFVDKILNYSSRSSYGNWKNKLCFVTDDVDEGWEHRFSLRADQLAEKLDTTHNHFNINKIYTDSYSQSVLSGAQRYPEAQEDLISAINNGTLVINYVGHGGETGWASERIFELSDINNLHNINKLPVFITATCEFTRYDDKDRISAGEYLILNPNGGAIGLFSTSRSVGEASASSLVNELYNYLPDRISQPTLGEVLMNAKSIEPSQSISGETKRKFAFFGDPNLKLSYPQYNVNTMQIELLDSLGQTIELDPGLASDTINSLSLVKIHGEITDQNNQKALFNGVLDVTFFDKPSIINLRNNEEVVVELSDSTLYPFSYTLKNNIIYRGSVDVIDGDFSCEFIVPKDISYEYGKGKISYYASDEFFGEATGAYENIFLGGLSDQYNTDFIGPEIELFLNDTNFVSGGYTNNNPQLLALLFDESGINMVGTGIGHDLRVVLDHDFSNPIVVNNYYEANINSYNSGRVIFPFSELSEGEHTLNFKAWDVHNNSNSAEITFFVTDNPKLAIQHLFNYPNPSSSFTKFVFEHNRPNDILDIKLQVFSLNHHLVKTFSKEMLSTGFRNESIEWNIDSNISPGIYIYRLTVTSKNDDSISEKTDKLIILR